MNEQTNEPVGKGEEQITVAEQYSSWPKFADRGNFSYNENRRESSLVAGQLAQRRIGEKNKRCSCLRNTSGCIAEQRSLVRVCCSHPQLVACLL